MSVQKTAENTEFQPLLMSAFSIRDVKTNTMHTPFFQTHKAGAMRAFSDLVRDPQSLIAKHPEDFQLFSIGKFDTNSGNLIPQLPVEFLANATDFLN